MIIPSPVINQTYPVRPSKYAAKVNGKDLFHGFFDWLILCEHLISRLPDVANIVEVGVYQGRCSVYMREVIDYNRPTAQIKQFCLDLFAPSERKDQYGEVVRTEKGETISDWGFNEAFYFVTKGEPQKYANGRSYLDDMYPVKAPSRMGLKMFDKNIPGDQIDMLIIDGDHSAWGCYEDLLLGVPRTADGGFVVVHDYHNEHCCEGVTTAIDIFAEDNKDLTVFSYQSENVPGNSKNEVLYFEVPKGFAFNFKTKEEFEKAIKKRAKKSA